MATLKILVSGKYRLYSSHYWELLEGPRPHTNFISNGCTMSPDYINDDRVWPACVIHDFHYNAVPLARKEADKRFRRNVVKCLQWDGMNRFFANVLAYIYYRVVRHAGEPFYNSGGNPR